MISTRPNRGFTLVEMIVVIAIIVVLAMFLAPMIGLFGGKGLRLARNAVAGYLDGLRAEAVNTNTGILVAILPGKRDEGTTFTITVKQGDGSTKIPVKAGIIPFYVQQDMLASGAKGNNPWDRLLYMDRNFTFEQEFNDAVQVHPALVSRWEHFEWPKIDSVTPQDIQAIGIPKSALLIFIRPDGRAIIPGDIPGYIVDAAKLNELNGDLIFEDGKAAFFLDVSPLMRVRGTLIEYDLMEGGEWKIGN